MTSRVEVTLPDSTFADTNMRYAADRGARRGRPAQARVRVPDVMTPTERYEATWNANERRVEGLHVSVADVVLEPSSTFEPDYDEDPADAVRTRRAVAAFPAEPTNYPNVSIGPIYRFGFAVASRFLEYQEQGIRFYDAVVLLAVEFDLTEEKEVTDLLAYMGIEETLSDASRSGPAGYAIVHGTLKTYKRLGCRCQRCRLAVEEHRVKVGLTRKIPHHSDRNPRVPRAQRPIPHGTNNGYTNYGCRCDSCREAARIARRNYTLSIKARKRDRERSDAIANRDY